MARTKASVQRLSQRNEGAKVNALVQNARKNEKEASLLKPVVKPRVGGVKRTPKHAVGAVVVKEVVRLQNSDKQVLPKAPFRRLVREIAAKNSSTKEFRFYEDALEAIQEAAEAYLNQVFVDAQACVEHRNAKTLTPKDMKLAIRLQGGVPDYSQTTAALPPAPENKKPTGEGLHGADYELFLLEKEQAELMAQLEESLKNNKRNL